MSEVIYHIDNNDMITYISASPWDEFALENSGYDVIEENILNKSIWSFITDPETVQIYKMIVDKVRLTGTKISIPFRCDAPDLRRFFIMDIEKTEKNLISFHSILKKVEKRNNVKLLEREILRSDDLLKVCSWCKKLEITGQDKWVEVEEAIIKLDLFKMEKLPILTHTMCNSCFEKMENHLE